MSEELSSQDITTLVDKLMQSKDPAVVGLQKIVRQRQHEYSQFPLRDIDFEDFGNENDGKAPEKDSTILSLEKQIASLRQKLKDTRKQSENALQKAYQKGVQQGLEKGKQQGLEEAKEEFDSRVQQLKERVERTCSQIDAEKGRVLHESEHNCIRLSFEVAKKVIDTEVNENREIVYNVVKSALGNIASKEQIHVRIAPDDADTLSGQDSFWQKAVNGIENVRVVPDSTIVRGGVIVETLSGDVDARREVRLEEIAQLVEEKWQQFAESSGGDSDNKGSADTHQESAAEEPPQE